MEPKSQLPLQVSGLPPPQGGQVDILIIAGEHSGDQNAGRMLRRLRVLNPDASVCALGGPALTAAGAQLLRDLTAHSVIGFVDALRQLSHFKRLLDEISAWVARYRPRLICFVDSSGLNLRIAERLARSGLSAKVGGPCRLVYYISPQIWASRPKRRFAMAAHLDALAVIFPFECKAYADTVLPVEFVGHPFLEDEYLPPVTFASDGPVLLLPGSRSSAVARIFPRMLAAWREAGRPEAVVISPSDAISAKVREMSPGEPISIRSAGAAQPASAILTTSGTMSMHCALAGIPGAVVYVAHPLEYWIGRMIVTVPYLGIASLLLNREVYPEFIQGAATPARLAEVLRAARSAPARDKAVADAAALRTLLGQAASGGPGDWLSRQWSLAQAAGANSI